MPSQQTSVPYNDPFFLFCNTLFYSVRSCNGVQELIPPKKVVVYDKPENRFTKIEHLRWMSRNRYR